MPNKPAMGSNGANWSKSSAWHQPGDACMPGGKGSWNWECSTVGPFHWGARRRSQPRRSQPRRRQEEATEREVSKVDDLSTDCCAVVGVLWKGESKMAHPAKKSLTKHGKKAAKMRSWVYTASVPLLSQLDHTDRQATQGLLPTCLQLWQWHQSPHNPSQLTITSAIHYPSHAHSRRLVLSWFGLAVLLWQSVREVLWHVCVCFFILLKISRLQVAFLQQDHTTQKAFESPLNKGLVLNLFRIVARNKVSSEVQ